MSISGGKTKSSIWRRWVYDRLIQLFPDTNPTSGYVPTADGSGGISYTAPSALGAGVWVEIDNTNISGSPTEFQLTWDESLYSDIMVVISGIQCANDGISLGLQLGEDDGATIHATAGDYDGLRLDWASGTSYSNFAVTSRIILLGSTGNLSDEVINGTIHIRGTHGANVGAFVDAQLIYQDFASNHNVQETKGFLDDGAAAGAIDTYRLSFNATTDRAWNNVGNITTYGLTR